MTLDEPIPEGLVQELVLKMFKDSKSKPEIRISKGSSVGEGFLGITCRVEVKMGTEVVRLFVKTLPENKKIRRALSLEEIFEREIIYYTKVHPEINRIFFKHLKVEFDLFPDCLLVNSNYSKEAIIFKDIGLEGYATLKDKTLLNRDEIMMTLKKYSYFHACGFIMQKENPEVFTEMTKMNKDLLVKVLSIYDVDKVISFALNILKRYCCVQEDEDILNRLEKIKIKSMDVVNHQNFLQEYSTVLHYDCWKNNLMFKHKANLDQVEDLKLVDMQLWIIKSPIFDVSHIVYCNVSLEDSLDLLDFYFEYYYKSLCSAILEMSGNPEDLYPRRVFESHMKQHCPYGIYIMTFVLRVLYANPKDIPNLAQMILKDIPLTEVFSYNLPDEKHFSEKMKLVMRHLIKIGAC